MDDQLNTIPTSAPFEIDPYLIQLGVQDRSPVEPNATKNQQQFIWELGYTNVEQIKALGKKQAMYLIDVLKKLEEHRNQKAEQELMVSMRKSKTKKLWLLTLVSFITLRFCEWVGTDWAVIVQGLSSLCFFVCLCWGTVSLFKYLRLRWRFRGKQDVLYVNTSVRPRNFKN